MQSAITLDQHHIIRLTKGKTNRQYLREILRNGRKALGSLLEQTMIRFEDVFFGNYPLERDQFEACWSQVPQFEQMVQESPA